MGSTECGARTVVLVGKVGNGKSATGNSILGERLFLSKPSPVGVTRTSDMQTTVVDGQIVNVIDTPGMFGYSLKPEMICDEILNCFKMAKDGIHGILVVLSIRSRCSGEETYAFANLLEIFGSKISDYMIVVFTGGDDLEENDDALDDYLGNHCPKPFKEILEMCGNRCILFDNKTKNSFKKSEQVKRLLIMVNEVVDKNAGIPYTVELLQQVQIDMKMNKVTLELEQELANEKAARLEAERVARVTLVKSGEHAQLLGESLTRTHKEGEKIRNKAGSGGSAILENLVKLGAQIKAETGGCAIL